MKITQNLMRVKELLLNPPTFSDNQARLQTNLDTDFLKLIAIVSMLIDHIGSVFFPEVRVLRWIGRLAFPIFCYCRVCQVFCVSFKKIFWGGEPPHLYHPTLLNDTLLKCFGNISNRVSCQ